MPHQKQHFSTCISALVTWLHSKRQLQKDHLLPSIHDTRSNMYVCPTRLRCVHLLCVAEFLFLLLQESVGQKLLPTFCLDRAGGILSLPGQ